MNNPVVTVEQLLEQLQYLIDNNFLNKDDIIILCGSGDKPTIALNGVVLPKIEKINVNAFNTSTGFIHIGFMSQENMFKYIEPLNFDIPTGIISYNKEDENEN